MWSSIIAGALLGFSGSMHCVGMCGPLVLVIGAKNQRDIAVYHLGRILSYSILGFAIGMVGEILIEWIGQQWGLIFSSILLFGIALQLVFPLHHIVLPNNIQQHITQLQRKLFQISPKKRALGLGLLTALLPCGLLYSAILLALASQRSVYSTVVMTSFAIASGIGMFLGQITLHTTLSAFSSTWKKRIQISLSVISILFLARLTWIQWQHHTETIDTDLQEHPSCH
jgi:sulfite exporter TauE/SafE